MDEGTIDRILTLSQIDLSGIERKKLADDLASIIDFIEVMNEVPTEEVQPLSHPVEMEHDLRPDKPVKDVKTDLIFANAPSTEDNMFLVPKVIEQR